MNVNCSDALLRGRRIVEVNPWWLAAVPALVAANGFFVAAEFALVSVRRSRVDEMVKGGSGPAKLVQRALDDLDGYIAGTQVGITLASLALGMVGEPVLAGLFEPYLQWVPWGEPVTSAHLVAVICAFAVITFLHVVLGELVPKSLALQRTERTVLWCARPLKWAVTLLRPLIWSLNGVGKMTLRLFGLQGGEGHHTAVHSVHELGLLLEQSRQAGVIDSQEHAIVERGLQFGEHVAREAMVPRLDVVALDLGRPIEALLSEIAAKDHTRLPCYEESVDNIVGVLNIRRLFPMLIAGETVTDLRPLLREPVVVPETLNLEQVFEAFRESAAEMAVVVDEFGGTAGIITLEDVIEEVFGEVDAADDPVRRGEDGVAHIRGDARLYEVNAALHWELVDEQNDTIGGYVVEKLGRTAVVGDEVEGPGGTTLRVHEVEQHRIKVLLLIEPPVSAS